MTKPHLEDPIVEHDPAAHQFQARLNGMQAVLDYRRAPGRDLRQRTHTQTRSGTNVHRYFRISVTDTNVQSTRSVCAPSVVAP